MEFFEKWDKLENCKAKILLKHSLFGRQMHNCDLVKTINDDRIGLILKGQDICMYKQDVVCAECGDKMYTVSDGKLTITLFVNKL
jgi:ethanolamine utilization protein EutQ (cupin superfamily)